MKEFVMGLALGMAGGAILVANSCKLRRMIKKNQEEFLQKAECYIDEKLGEGQSQTGGQQDAAEQGSAKKGKEN